MGRKSNLKSKRSSNSSVELEMSDMSDDGRFKALFNPFLKSLVELDKKVKSNFKIKLPFFKTSKELIEKRRQWEEFKKDWKINYMPIKKNLKYDDLIKYLERDLLIILEHKGGLYSQYKSIFSNAEELYPLVRKKNKSAYLALIKADSIRPGTDRPEYLNANQVAIECANELVTEGI